MEQGGVPSRRVNRRWLLAEYPEGLPKETTFRYEERPVPEPADGQVLVRTLYLSVDPYQRGRMHTRKSYAKPMDVGDVIVGGAVGRVEVSRHRDVPEGCFVEGLLGWQDYALSDGAGLRRLDLPPDLLPAALGVLGMPGLTAYFGLMDVGKPRAGETVVISGAAGAVGTVVGQIARIQGCRAVGIAGSAEKVRVLVEDLGFDAAVDYKAAADLRGALGEACPHGVDVYFDNVGGAVTDAAISLLALRARVIICGQISQYNLTKPARGPRNLTAFLTNRAMLQGILVSDWADRYDEGIRQLTAWLREGKLRSLETIVEGFENAPTAFMGLFHGHNVGKMLVRIAQAPV